MDDDLGVVPHFRTPPGLAVIQRYLARDLAANQLFAFVREVLAHGLRFGAGNHTVHAEWAGRRPGVHA